LKASRSWVTSVRLAMRTWPIVFGLRLVSMPKINRGRKIWMFKLTPASFSENERRDGRAQQMEIEILVRGWAVGLGIQIVEAGPGRRLHREPCFATGFACTARLNLGQWRFP
jgi:hypothetical protein